MIREARYSDPELPPELKCQILAFMRVEWAEGFVGANRRRGWITSPARHPLHFVLTEDHVLISYTGVVWDMLEHAGNTFKTYGLSGVFTYPAFRGEGHGSRLVERATHYIQASDADIAILFCDPKRKNFYGRSGWRAVEGSATLVGEPQNAAIYPELRMMLFVSEKGERARPRFENEPVYFGKDAW